MEDVVINTEILFNWISTLLGKAVLYKDDKCMSELLQIRNSMYYDKTINLNEILKKVKAIDIELKKYV